MQINEFFTLPVPLHDVQITLPVPVQKLQSLKKIVA